MNTATPAWANRAAAAIVNNVDANPALHFDAKNVTAAHMARIIAEHAPVDDLMAALNTIAYEPIGHSEASYQQVHDAIVEIARAALEKAKGLAR